MQEHTKHRLLLCDRRKLKKMRKGLDLGKRMKRKRRKTISYLVGPGEQKAEPFVKMLQRVLQLRLSYNILQKQLPK